MPDDRWHKLNHGLYESADGQWRITNPHMLTTELRHRWLVAQRRTSGMGWQMHDGDHATLYGARAYVAALTDAEPPPSISTTTTSPANRRRQKPDDRRATLRLGHAYRLDRSGCPTPMQTARIPQFLRPMRSPTKVV